MIERFRNFGLRFMSRRRLAELKIVLAALSIVNGAQAMQYWEGRPIAPYLQSALQFLVFDEMIWGGLLIGCGVAALLFLLLKQFTGKSYALYQAVLYAVLMAIYMAVCVAIITGPQPFIVAWRYMVVGVGSFYVSLVLFIQSQIEKDALEIPVELEVV